MNSVNTKIIGFWRGWSIAVGCAIGSGIFMMPTLLAPYGLIGFGGWLIAGVVWCCWEKIFCEPLIFADDRL